MLSQIQISRLNALPKFDHSNQQANITCYTSFARVWLIVVLRQARKTNNIAYLVCYENIVEYSLRYFQRQL